MAELNNPKISIIVPVYNAESYLKKCIDSILQQPYFNLEVILVDDGSKDSSGNICDDYSSKDIRIKAIHVANGGASKARNIGLDNCSGQWVSFVDADDYLLPDTFTSEMFEEFDGNSYDMVEFPYVRGNCPKMTYRKGAYRNRKFQSFYTNYFHNELWGRLFSRDAIGDLRFDDKIVIGEDVLFLMEILAICKTMYYWNQGGYFYNITSESLMRSSDKAFLDEQRYVLLNTFERKGVLNQKLVIAFYFRLYELLKSSNTKFCDYLKEKHVISIKRLLCSSFTIKKKIKYLLTI